MIRRQPMPAARGLTCSSNLAPDVTSAVNLAGAIMRGCIPRGGTCTDDDTDVEAWFPSETEAEARPGYYRILCQGCPVKRECLVKALENNEKFGVFGGTLPADRERIAAGEASVDEFMDKVCMYCGNFVHRRGGEKADSWLWRNYHPECIEPMGELLDRRYAEMVAANAARGAVREAADGA